MLGKPTIYEFSYNPNLLNPIARKEGRSLMGIYENLPFEGLDRWTAYEVSWLNNNGLPHAAIVEFDFPCSSPYLIESKSFKLYLNSLNQSIFANQNAVEQILIKDLTHACGSEINVRFFAVNDYQIKQPIDFLCIDTLDVECVEYSPNASLLQFDNKLVQQKLCSHLFRSLCPVTGQPDWASIYIECIGTCIDTESLLKYLVSFRNHQGFHEQCVEQIFVDLSQNSRFDQLIVYARFLRRGGLDINPYRAKNTEILQHVRIPRQ